MEIAVDLHAHSMFAGGSGGLSLKPENFQASMKKAHSRFDVADNNSRLKGIQILGTGDIQFTPWLNFIKENFIEEDGLFKYNKGKELRYCLQTEIIITARVSKKVRKSAHVVILFPNFNSIDEFKAILDKYEVKQERLPRPFLKLETKIEVSQALYEIQDIHPSIEIIPGHVMTPEGVYGGNNGVNSLYDFFGDFSRKISIIETGLSADPEILSLIPELDSKILLSNADAHSSQLHRIGREFTVINSNKLSYNGLINSLRTKEISFTLEFPPTEGRFFLTGHRSNRKKPGKGHGKYEFCYYSPENVPQGTVCPICDKQMTKGVLQRAFEICESQGETRTLRTKNSKKLSQHYLHGVPLVEVIANALKIKSPNAKSVLKEYHKLISTYGSEVDIWKSSEDYIKSNFPTQVPESILNAITLIKDDKFSFSPPGFDGEYGKLALGQKENYFGHEVVQRG